MKQFIKRAAHLATALVFMGTFLVPLHAFALTSTIWSATDTPSNPNVNDTNAVELGVKFKSSVGGQISGIRFYKGSGNGGTHVGNLWTLGGTKLASVTFSGESASGWQEADFAAPVSITANTVYVASYYAPQGHYAANGGYFASSAITHGPLTALRDGTSGGNGVYRYGSTSGFPSSSYNATNYWVDVVFQDSGTPPPDTTPPTVSNVTPANGATNVAKTTNVTAAFSEALDSSTVTSSTFTLRDSNNTVVPATVTYGSGNSATLDPSADLAANATYTATIKGGTTDPRIKDIAGNALANNYSWSFTTASDATPPDDPTLEQGAGGPILVVTADDKPFSKYYAEILRAEGFDEFTSKNIGEVDSTLLNQYQVVVLGEVPVTDAQVTMLSDWVNAGGNLVAMRPDKKLAGLLGITDQFSTLSDEYLKVDTAHRPGAGIVGQTIQFHGTADKYTLNSGTSAVATLYSDASTATSNPAVTLRSVGSNGGQAAAFTYDLAKSVVYLHQGNPAWAGQERDGVAPIRPDDMFFGAKSGDVQPDWVNLNKVAIPQADEQQRLLTNTIQFMNQDKNPLPKLWYFPNGKKAAIVMAGDDHTTLNGTQTVFDRLKAASPAGCSVANWECYRATSWLYANSGLSNAQAAGYYADGFDMGDHLNNSCQNMDQATLDAAFTTQLQDFKDKYTSLPDQHGQRVHCAAWGDWAGTVKAELNHGMRMDLNYYYWPNAWVQNHPGFMSGSGIPMRFGDSDGSMIDVYQVPSNLVNESGMTYPDAINAVLDKATGPEGYYGAFGTHYDYSDNFDQQLVASAQAHNVPVVSVQQMLDWTDGRNASYLNNIAWNGNSLAFTGHADVKTGSMLRGMLPVNSAKGVLQTISKDGANVSFTTETIKGVKYAFFPVSDGQFSATYQADIIAPTVTSSTPTNGATGVSTTASLSATFSEDVDALSVTSGTVELRDASNNLVAGTVSYDSAQQKVTFKPSAPLATSMAYKLTLKGGTADPRITDLSGNALSSNYEVNFTTTNIGPDSTIWSSSTTPITISSNDPNAVELGVKFKSDVDGYVKGIRFYKSASNTGMHTGTLWSGSGAALATVTFTNESVSGWQQATFSTPVHVTANTVYVASYHTNAGMYSVDSGYFASGVDNPPLHALQDGASGNNGVYRYGSGGVMPSDSYNASNYWVDVIFNTAI